MKDKTIINRLLSTAHNLRFSEQHLKEIGYIINGKWCKRDSCSNEVFEEVLKNNKSLYKKLGKYQDKIFYSTDITKDEFQNIHDALKEILG